MLMLENRNMVDNHLMSIVKEMYEVYVDVQYIYYRIVVENINEYDDLVDDCIDLKIIVNVVVHDKNEMDIHLLIYMNSMTMLLIDLDY